MPVIQAAPDTIMNSVVLVRAAGTPTERAASLLPPTAIIQLPNWVRIRSQEPMAAKTRNDSTTTPNWVCGHLSSPSVPTVQIVSSSLPVTNISRVATLSNTAPIPTETRARPTPSSSVIRVRPTVPAA